MAKDAVEAISDYQFWRSRGQGQGYNKVIYLSELLEREEVSISTLGRRINIYFPIHCFVAFWHEIKFN